MLPVVLEIEVFDLLLPIQTIFQNTKTIWITWLNPSKPLEDNYWSFPDKIQGVPNDFPPKPRRNQIRKIEVRWNNSFRKINRVHRWSLVEFLSKKYVE